jgi:AAA+ ATPase superfamily predicted ATPase
MAKINPFITNGYLSEDYFCDRVEETARLTQLLLNGNNVALISPRRTGKTGLVAHCFHQREMKEQYYTFLVDIYATKNLQEFVFELGRSVLNQLKPKGKKIRENFIRAIASLRTGITFDERGIPSWNVEIGDIKNPAATLQEIFDYLQAADKPCLVAIDEFQTVIKYPEKNIEAVLRTYIQHCPNAHFIFSGSQRHMMAEIFASPSRPFYQSTSILELPCIPLVKYAEFVQHHFKANGKEIQAEVISQVYEQFEGITWYMQFIMNHLYASTREGEVCTPNELQPVIDDILNQMSFTYNALLYQLPPKQKELLFAISRMGKVSGITSSEFLNTFKMSASSVQSAIRGLLEKDLVTSEMGVYSVYDKLFGIWLKGDKR